LPKHVRAVFGYAILVAQTGEKYDDAKSLKGFGGAGVLEVVEDYDKSTYRAVYTVKFEGVVCPSCLPEKVEEGQGHA
jgi:phage-related protein